VNQELFQTPPPEPRFIARVAIARGIDKVLDYLIPSSLVPRIRVGQRVRVPLGRGDKLAFGFVARLVDQSDYPRLKPLEAVTDDRPLLNAVLMDLALWLSRYYATPLGLVLDNMLPSAVKKRTGAKRVRVVRSKLGPDELMRVAETVKQPKRRAILTRLLQLEPGASVPLFKLASESGVKPPAVAALEKMGLISIETVDDDDNPLTVSESLDVPRPTLTSDQHRVVEAIDAQLQGGFGVHLVHGVTGSGKTEVYLRLIERVVAAGKSAIVLVPEIALTPQTVARFTHRFSGVAVMHSGLPAGERYRQWSAISSGQARVVVGARSAVFAPTPDTGLIVVDEEHEPSYKQDTSPRYHARDVAIKRAQIESIPVLLGSATPSLEMWKLCHGAGEARTYLTHSLPSRVSDRPLPVVELVDLKHANKGRPGIHLLSPRLESLMTRIFEQREQAILLLNRRGYSNFIFCSSCQTPAQCKYCDKTLTYHRAVGVTPANFSTEAASHAGNAHCHYCLAVQPLPTTCAECGKKLSLFGLGTQRVEEEVRRKFPNLVFERVDSDTMRSGRDYEHLLARFARGEVQMLMGTQMLAKGLDFPNVTLVGVINGDTALSLPDFRAGERTFQLLTQVAGRAGRGTKPGRVIIQTFLPDDPVIREATTQDYVAFAQRELLDRQRIGLPPFARLVRIIIRDEDLQHATNRAEQIASEIEAAIGTDAVEMKGPSPCVVGRIAGFHRQQILLTSPKATLLQQVLARVRHKCKLVSDDRTAIDVDPVSML
jgi:primosomal protein N' (replication factor Y)